VRAELRSARGMELLLGLVKWCGRAASPAQCPSPSRLSKDRSSTVSVYPHKRSCKYPSTVYPQLLLDARLSGVPCSGASRGGWSDAG
jgi:hypothetical protein